MSWVAIDLDHPFFGATVVLTGTLQSVVRRDAMQHVLNLGRRGCAPGPG
jgi:NAD-dependent DNA ligase